MYVWRAMHKRKEEQGKKSKTSKIFGHCKSGQNAEKRDNNIKCPKKKGKKEKEDRTKSKVSRQNVLKSKAKKKVDRKNKELRETGICCHQKTCNNKQCKIRNG